MEESEDQNPEEEGITEFITTPPLFHSFENDGPFDKCIRCQSDLLQDGALHLIEKAWDGNEVVFEYALCFTCQFEVTDEMSVGSRRLIENFLDEHVDYSVRKSAFIERHGLDHEPWIEKCLICGAKWDELRWKQVIGFCDGPDLLFIDRAPIMLCEKEIEKIYGLLSKKTKDTMGDFFDEVLGMPTDTVDLPVLL